jgi:alpha-L-fucosidase
MRRRSHLTAAEWQKRLDALMRRVLAAPERYHPSTVYWARWRARWLTECARREGGRNPYSVSSDTGARAQFSRAPARLNAAAPQEVNDEAP